MLPSARQVLRSTFRSPAFSLTVILSVALGIAANLVIFSIANSLFFRPLSANRSERLAFVYTSYKDDLKWGSTSYPDYVDLRDGTDAFSDLSAERIVALSLGIGEYNQRIYGSMVSPNYFRTLAAEAFRGRVFSPEETTSIILSFDLWRKSFGADPQWVGRKLLVNGTPFTVIGVMPKSFHGLTVGYNPHFWIPMESEAALVPGSTYLRDRNLRSLFVLGRLRDGIGVPQAGARLNQVASRLAEAYKKTNAAVSFTVIPAAEGALHPMYRPTFKIILGLLFVVVGLVLLIACSNIAALVLARTNARRAELGIRIALGSSRSSLVAQLLAECLFLSLLGGGLALLIAAVSNRAIEAFAPMADLPIAIDLTIDHRVFAFALFVAALTGVLFGLAPALRGTGVDVVEALRGNSQGPGLRRSRLRTIFLFSQIALSVVLVVAAGLVVQGLQRAKNADLGFNPDRVLASTVDLGLRNYSDAAGKRFYRRFVDQLSQVPGVESVALASSMPLDLFGSQRSLTPAEADTSDSDTKKHLTDFNVVYPSYFETLGIRLLHGRNFTLHDADGAPPVAIVSQRLADLYWPGADAVGKSIRGEDKLYEIVGVVSDTKSGGLVESVKPFAYFSLLQEYAPNVNVLVRTRSRGGAPAASFHQVLKEMDPSLALYNEQSLKHHLEILLLIPRAAANVLGGFGLLAVALASLGVYGTLAYAVSQRTREIGIRIALGATPKKILRMIMSEGMRLAVVAAGCGLLLASVVTRFLESLLFGVSPLSPVVFAGALALLLLVTGAASYLSARKSLKIDPLIALKGAI